MLVILNPSSGQHSEEETCSLIEEYFKNAGCEFEIRVTKGEGDALGWAKSAEQDGFDLVLVAGGDGTIMEAMSGLIDSKASIPLAQVPVGTANLLARALAIPTDIAESLDVLSTGREERLDVGYLPDQKRYFALVAGCGYDAQLIGDATRELKNILGFGAYIITGFTNLFRLRLSRIEMTVDGRTERFRANTVMIVNVGEIANMGIKLGENIHPHDGKLDVIIAKPASVFGALGILLRILTGRFKGHNDLRYLRVERVSIKAKPALPTEIDGEALGETPLIIETVPGGALLLVSAEYKAKAEAEQNA